MSGNCKLRNAIVAANKDKAVKGCKAGSGADTIRLTSDITLTAELPKIKSHITIEGGNFTLDGGNRFRLIYVGGGTAVINNLKLQHGFNADRGGAVYIPNGSLTINNSVIVNNRTNGKGGAMRIKNGSVTINDSNISGNEARLNGGAISSRGPKLTINNSVIMGNRAHKLGGGIHVWGDSSKLVLNNSQIAFNLAGKSGGISAKKAPKPVLNNSSVHNNMPTDF